MMSSDVDLLDLYAMSYWRY